jgi:hypothetical protein
MRMLTIACSGRQFKPAISGKQWTLRAGGWRRRPANFCAPTQRSIPIWSWLESTSGSLLAFVSALIILLIGMLGDALATRLGQLNPQIIGVRTVDFVQAEKSEEKPEG